MYVCCNITILRYNYIIYRVAVYKEQTTAWYDYKTNDEIINIRFYSNIIKSISICGLTGLDKLIGFMIVAEIMVNNILNAWC